jgi:hypothetical protein
VPAEGPYAIVLLHYLNKIYVTDRTRFWTKKVRLVPGATRSYILKIKAILLDKFMYSLSPREMEESYDISTAIDMKRVLVRIQEMTGIKLRVCSLL